MDDANSLDRVGCCGGGDGSEADRYSARQNALAFAKKIHRSHLKQFIANPLLAAEALKSFDTVMDAVDLMQTEAYAKAVEEKFSR